MTVYLSNGASLLVVVPLAFFIATIFIVAFYCHYLMCEKLDISDSIGWGIGKVAPRTRLLQGVRLFGTLYDSNRAKLIVNHVLMIDDTSLNVIS